MKIFIDTAKLEEVKRAGSWGVLAGVTTNPSLIAKEGQDLAQAVKKIADLVDGPISAEVMAEDAQGMVQEGQDLAAISQNIVIKVPMTEEGLKAIREFSGLGIKTNCTLVFSPGQALLAARAGASFVSPFLGRLDDIGHEGVDLVRTIAKIYNIHGIGTEIIAASIRHPDHVTQAALAGAHIATIPYKVLDLMVHHPLTDRGIDQFKKDFEESQRRSK